MARQNFFGFGKESITKVSLNRTINRFRLDCYNSVVDAVASSAITFIAVAFAFACTAITAVAVAVVLRNYILPLPVPLGNHLFLVPFLPFYNPFYLSL